MEIVFVGANDQIPASPNVPGRRPFHSAPCAWAQSSISDDPLAAAELRDPLGIEGDVAADVHEERRPRPVLVHLPLEVVERHAEVVAVAVDELDARARADRAQSGVAMNVFDGHSTVSPRTPAHSSAASAAPVQPLNATASRPFQPAQAPSNSFVSSPSDHWFAVEDPLPEGVQARAVALVEADGEAGKVGRDVRGQASAQAYRADQRSSPSLA